MASNDLRRHCARTRRISASRKMCGHPKRLLYELVPQLSRGKTKMDVKVMLNQTQQGDSHRVGQLRSRRRRGD